MTRQQQSCPLEARAGSFAHEHIGSSNSTQINNAYCPFPSTSFSSLLPTLSSSPPLSSAHEHFGSSNSTQINNAHCPPPSSSSLLVPPSSSPPPLSSAHGHRILDAPLCLSSINSIPPVITATSNALELEYSVPPLQESPFHPDTNPQPPLLASSEFTPDDQDYKLYMTDTDEEILDKILESLQFEGLQCHESWESLVIDGQSYSRDDDTCLPHATSLLPNLDSQCPTTMSDNISNFTSPQIPNFGEDTDDLKCFNQEDAISSTPGWSSPADSNVTHGCVGKEAADEFINISDLVGDMAEQSNRYDDHGAYTVKLSVNTKKLDLDDGYRWHKYGRKKIKSKGDDHPRDYLKCAKKDCPAKKRAELSSEREGHSIFTYKHRHNHHPYH